LTTDKSVIKQIQTKTCWHCGEIINDHSKKNLMRCHYATEFNLYKAIQKIGDMSKKLEKYEPKEDKKE